MLKATELAVNKINEKFSNLMKNVEDPHIRLSVIIGCGGSRLQIDLEEEATENDFVVEVDGTKFVIANYQKRYFENMLLDYREDEENKFKLVYSN